MFFNAQNPMFPFQMPNMNGQAPFQFPFQMPGWNGQMPFQFPFPNPFQTGAAKPADEAAGEDGQAAQQACNPFAFFQQQMSQMPFQFPFFPFQTGAGKAEGDAAAEGEDAQADAQQACNPFEFFRQMFQMQQFMDMFKNMFSAFGMNPQNWSCPQGFNPFGGFQMPNMNAQMQQAQQMQQQFMDMFKNMFSTFGMNPQNWNCQQGFNPFGGFQMPSMNEQLQQFADLLKKQFAALGLTGDKQDSGLPFGMPVKLLQFLLHMDSTPEGLSKFQKILDMIFDEYSKARTPAAE